MNLVCPMAESHGLDLLTEELDRWHDGGRTARLWLRDDDAVEPTAALERLIELLRAHAVPCLLAAIPMLATPELAERTAEEPLLTVGMHGVRHANHAPPGRKTEETPSERGLDRIRSDWAQARERLVSLFGPAAGVCYVPPWNRIGREAAALLPELGFQALSGFGPRPLGASPQLIELNTHVDLMDWRGGRVGRQEGDIAADMTQALGQARADGWRPVGLLAHHLVHDAAAWEALDTVLNLCARHPAARWCVPAELLAA
jgi:peptidoglycan/xylan/chitin deacetylase (PgdA/CDA1 family)